MGNGAIYAMLGLGLVVIYRSTGLLNFAQGEITMFATFIVWQVWDLWASPLPLAVLIGAAAAFLIGVITQWVVIQPFGDPHQKPLTLVIVTIGLYLGFNALAQLIWGTESRPFPALFGRGSVQVFGVAVAWQKLGALGVLVVEAGILWLIFQRTKLGLAMRAVASNSESSALVGVPVNRILMTGWGVAAALGAVAGSFTASSRFGVDSSLMLLTIVYAFAAITLGGFDSLPGAVVGGLLVGVVSEVVPRYVSFMSKMPLMPAFILIMAVLLLRPEGLLGTKKVSRV
ncbi:MAG: branched-chain amino acid ABC transporter permease [Microthrixaceae bacterium]